MRAVIDTNIILSALMLPSSLPGRVLDSWRRGHFVMLTCEPHLAELRLTTRYPKVRARVPQATSGRLVNEIGKLAEFVEKLPTIDACRDPMDNFLLAMAEAGRADFLVTGDKLDLLSMQKHGATAIVSARQFAAILRI